MGTFARREEERPAKNRIASQAALIGIELPSSLRSFRLRKEASDFAIKLRRDETPRQAAAASRRTSRIVAPWAEPFWPCPAFLRHGQKETLFSLSSSVSSQTQANLQLVSSKLASEDGSGREKTFSLQRLKSLAKYLRMRT